MSDIARRHLSSLAAMYGRPAGPGHSEVAHRDLGYCCACVHSAEPRAAAYVPVATEVSGWRLLAMIDRGHAYQEGTPA